MKANSRAKEVESDEMTDISYSSTDAAAGSRASQPEPSTSHERKQKRTREGENNSTTNDSSDSDESDRPASKRQKVSHYTSDGRRRKWYKPPRMILPSSENHDGNEEDEKDSENGHSRHSHDDKDQPSTCATPSQRQYTNPTATTPYELIQCTMCHEELDCVAPSVAAASAAAAGSSILPDRRPRSLPCGDSCCSECIRRWIETNMSAGRSQFVCPTCNKSHSFSRTPVAAQPAAASSSSAVNAGTSVPEAAIQALESFPLTRALIRAAEAFQAQHQQVAAQARKICTHTGCKQPATRFCLHCAELCEAHEIATHKDPDWQAHPRGPLEDAKAIQAKHREELFTSKALAIREKLNSSLNSLMELKKQFESLAKLRVNSKKDQIKLVHSNRGELEEAKSQLDKLLALCDSDEAKLNAQVKHESEVLSGISSRAASIMRLRALEGENLVHQSVGEFDGLKLGSFLADCAQTLKDAEDTQQIRPLEPMTSQLVSMLSRSLNRRPASSRLLRTAGAIDFLSRHLDPARLASATLVYCASEDGWSLGDFLARARTSGPTLTLVKSKSKVSGAAAAAGTAGGDIFGAYTAVPYPKKLPSGERYMNVPDPLGQSFLFSISNKYGTPFRLSLKDKSNSLYLSSLSFGFGASSSDSEWGANFYLFDETVANASDGCWMNMKVSEQRKRAYQLDPWTAKNPAPPKFKLDETTMAGQEHFAADEIEAYALAPVAAAAGGRSSGR